MIASTQAELELNTQVFSFEHAFLVALLPPPLFKLNSERILLYFKEKYLIRY